MDNLITKVGALGATILVLAVVGLTCLMALRLWQHVFKPKQARGQVSTGISVSPEAASVQAGAPLDTVTEDELSEALGRLAVLPQFQADMNGGLVDCHGGAFLSRRSGNDDSCPQLMVAWRRENTLNLVTRAALERYVTYQEGLSRLLMKSEARSEGGLE
jgi:hypothetical protein